MSNGTNGNGKSWLAGLIGAIALPTILAALGIVGKVADIEKKVEGLEKQINLIDLKLEHYLGKKF